jgi:PAS domain S-box-containing protein
MPAQLGERVFLMVESSEGPFPRLSPALSKAQVCHTGEIVLLTDDDGQILDASDSAAAAYGRGRRDLIGVNVSSLYAPEAAGATAVLGQTHEGLHVRADSSTFPVEIHTAGLEVAGKGFFLTTVRDISDRKRAEGVQPATEARFRGVVESVPMLIWITDEQGNCTYVNQRFIAFSGISLAESLGRHWSTLIRLEDFSLPSEITLKARNVAGENRWLMCRFSRQFGADGRADGYLGTALDVTESQQAEDRLRQLSCAVEQGAAIVMITDVDGNIEYVNPRFTQITGYSAAEVRNRNPRILKSGDTSPKVYRDLWETIRAGVAWHGQFQNRKKNGEVYWESASISPIRNPQGTVTHYVAVGEDMTAWKHSADAIQQTNRLLQQLSMDLLRSQDYEKRKIARELHDSTAQLLAALSINLGLLRDSDLDTSQRSTLLSETIDVAGQCSQEVRTLAYLLHPPLLDDLGLRGALQTYAQGFHHRTGIELELKIPPEFGRLDPGLEMTIFRIVQEGLSNINRYSGSALAEIRLERDAREVRLYLLDHGRGLPAASIPQKKESVRLGVGILGMRQRAEQLGGTLEIASTDVGTTLIITLPMPDSKDETAPAAQG